MSSESDAVLAADYLLVTLIQHQPNLLAIQGTHGEGGRKLGEAITELRQQLIQMYKKQPRG